MINNIMQNKNMKTCLMAHNKTHPRKYQSIIIYSICLALLLFLLRWLELRFILFSHSFAIYVGFIAFIFTALGIWFAQKLSRPMIKTVVIEKEIPVSLNGNRPGRQKDFILNSDLISQLQISNRELEILNLLAQGYSNMEIAEKIYVSISTVKTHNQNLYAKLNVSRRTQAVEMAKRKNLIP